MSGKLLGALHGAGEAGTKRGLEKLKPKNNIPGKRIRKRKGGE